MSGLYDKDTTQVIHFEDSGFIYVICNVLIEDYDSDLRPFQRYNVSAVYTDPMVKSIGNNIIVISKSKLMPIFLPDLIARINKETNEVVYGNSHEELL
jgi:hypothetical protein